ncbi:M1 family aminopeptidase [Sphingomonas sp.]|uniref:M1 family metallopeptidase n=1 Tax=Sphingomonas sp. TaxID=28214 RepID=UPI003B001EB5
MKRSFLAALACATLPAAALAAATPAGDAPQGRLPDAAVPKAYRVDLTVDPAQPRFSGHVEIDVLVQASSRSLWIHGRDLKVSSASAKVGGRTIRATYTQVDPQGVAKLDFAQPLPAGAATLAFDYDAPFGDGPSGLYHIQAGGRWYAWTQFESVDARAAYPSFDQPGYKTPFTVSLTTRPGAVAVSNAPETGTTPAKAGMVRHAFAATRPLPTYLTAFMVGPFAIASGQAAPTPERAQPMPVRVVATQPNKDKLDYALANTGPIVGLLERYFGRPFPFPKLDQIGSPVMPGAMENAGADTYGDDILLLDKGAPTAQQQAFGMTVSHELAHQWFGDLVTPAWWDDIWLNESFANWMGYRIGNEWRPDLKIGAGAIGEAFSAMNTDALTAGRPIHQAIATTGDIDTAFDAVTYGKGGQVVAMIAAYMGDATFQKGVRLHLDRHAYGNATTDQFFQSLADAGHDPRITASLKSFVDQQGVPLVTVSRKGGTITFSQKPYAMLGTTPAPRSWIIPVCYSVGGKRDCVLMDKPTMTVAAKSKGIVMPNAGGNGYYRFTLDQGDWRTLAMQAGTLPPGEALAVNDSLWASFRAGEAPAAALLAEARAVSTNPYSDAAVEPGSRFRSLRVRGFIDQASVPVYRRAMDAIYGPRLAAIGSDPKPGAYASDDPDRQKLRAALVRIVGIDAADPAVRAKLDGAAKAWLGGDRQALDQSLYGSAFAAHVAAGGLPAAQALYEKMVTSDDALFRRAAMSAIAGSGDMDVAQWLAGKIDDARLRQNEKLYAVMYTLSEPATRDFGYRQLLQNFDRFTKSAGIFTASALVGAPVAYCSTDAAAMIDRDLRPKVVEYKVSPIDLDRTIEQVRDCGVLKQAKGAEMATALGG